MIAATKAAPGLDRNGLVGFLRSALADSSVPHELDFNAAGMIVRFRAEAPELVRAYGPRLLPSTADAPDYRIDARIVADLPRWGDDRYHPRAFYEALDAHGLRAAYPYRQGLWQVLDLRSGRGALLLGGLDVLPPWDSGAPLRQHLHWLLRVRGMRLVHAATLGREGGGILVVGNSGAGKSGMTLAGLSVGLQTVGDDYVAISGGQTIAYPLYRIIKQDRLGLGRIPQLAAESGYMPVNWKGKVELDPEVHFPGSFASALAIRAIVVPRIAQLAKPQWRSIAGGDALLAMMRSNLHQFPGEPDDGMGLFGSMLRRLPVFEMDLSGDFQRNGEAARALLDEVEGRAVA